MADCKKVVNHIFLAKFMKQVSEEQIEECIKGFADMVDLVPSMKSFKWGKEMAIANFHQDFTHVFETTFESAEGVIEYVYHPRHVDFAILFLPKLEKFAVFDFETTQVPS